MKARISPKQVDASQREPPIKLINSNSAPMPEAVEGTESVGLVSEQTDLMKAVLANDLEATRRHLDQLGCFTEDGETSLMRAAKKGYASLIPLLSECEINMQDIDGYTALMYAACYNHAEVVNQLTAEYGKQTKTGWTALMLAVFHNSLDCIPSLLSERLLQNRMGQTAQELAQKGGRTEALHILTTTSNPS